ncbi:hypothetical protein LTR85_002751 [Meristemomyces frigidus]|nr:hypothetical protein LTR85_002751 [Meristemomyces frigidus]
MSGLMEKAEQAFSGGDSNQQSDDQQSGSNDQQSSGSSDQSSSGGGFMSKAEGVGEDAMVDQEVNSFATKEGIPAGADGFIDKEVNSEVGKF